MIISKEKLFKLNKEYIDVIKDLYATYGNKKMRFLDIGCGNGDYIDFHVQYFDNIELADLIDRRRGVSINYPFHRLDLNEALDSRECYDFIVCLEVIEHLSDIARGINNLKNMLMRGGYLLISTPNKLKLAERTKNLLGMPTVFSTKGDFINKHFQEFSMIELIEVFADNFEVVYKKYVLNRIKSFILPFSLPQDYKQNIIVLLRKK